MPAQKKLNWPLWKQSTFIFHSPLEFYDDPLSSQIVEERFGIDWYSLKYSDNKSKWKSKRIVYVVEGNIKWTGE